MDAYATALKAWLDEPGRTQKSLAERIGTTQPSLHRYATGERFPERELAQRIHDATEGGVPISIWQKAALDRFGISGEAAAA